MTLLLFQQDVGHVEHVPVQSRQHSPEAVAVGVSLGQDSRYDAQAYLPVDARATPLLCVEFVYKVGRGVERRPPQPGNFVLLVGYQRSVHVVVERQV